MNSIVEEMKSVVASIKNGTYKVNNAAAQVKKDLAYYEAKLEKDKEGKPVTYWDKHLKNRKDPVYQAKLVAAEAEGRVKAEQIVKDAMDMRSAMHDQARSLYNKFSEKGLTDECTAKCMNEMGVEPIQDQNDSYEKKALSKYTSGNGKQIAFDPKNANDSFVLDKFRATMKAKWKVDGYKNDADYIADFFKEPNNVLSQFTPENPAPGINTGATPAVKPASY